MARGEGQKSFRFPKGPPQAGAPETGRAEFGTPIPQQEGHNPRRKLSMKEQGPGFFTDPSLKNPNIFEFTRDPEIPINYVWVKAGSFSTGPINSDVEDHGGVLVKRARITSLGKKLKIYGNAGTGSFTGRIVEVKDAKDRRFLSKFGWWREDQLSDEDEEGSGSEKPTF